jgi:hypothetical protein
MSPGDRVAQLYSQALGYLFVAINDSDRYAGDIATSLHSGEQMLLKASIFAQ